MKIMQTWLDFCHDKPFMSIHAWICIVWVFKCDMFEMLWWCCRSSFTTFAWNTCYSL